jgi:hypothetical protein
MPSAQRRVGRLQNLSRWAVQCWRALRVALLLGVLLLSLTGEIPPPADMETRIKRQLAGERFDFVGWEVEALWDKLMHSLIAPQRYLSEPDRHDLLLDYLERVAEAQRIEWEIYRVYTDPEVNDPDAVAAALRDQLVELRAAIEARQPLVEAILEEQVACVLAEEGFGLLGQEIPPVGAHFTPLPLMLIVSPRDHIESIFTLGLRHGLDVARQEAIEEQVDTSHGVSSLVTRIGGLSAYPAMLLESSSPSWVAEVTAHEWTHHYLTPRPLGWNYNAIPEARVINETVATIVGQEIGRRMLARYYPEHLPPEPESEEPKEEIPPSGPPEFDFRMEMRQTRIWVDNLLAEGKIEQAEAYMERRRQVFVDQGYYIRKLNQAYFAFHGAYAAEPGAAGEDPIGPAVRELHARSPDLHTFAARAARVTTLAELEALLGEIGE